ncbi:MAG TPA: hypothetical protein VEJ18_19590, partial [Planctomycetota bacterium]|nr:hypothetical protein [Planctomycetota bacterium]
MTLLLLALAAQEPQFTGFEFARERVGHKVVAEAALFNGLAKPLAEGRLVVVYFDRTLELKRSAAVAVPRLEPGATATLKIEVVQLPNFSRYEVYLQDGPQVWVFLGEDPLKPPVLKKREPARLEVVDAKPSDGALTLVVRNMGEIDAAEPTALLADGTRVRLADAVRAATEDTFSIPTSASLSKIAWLVAEGPSQATPKDVPQIALRRFRTIRLTDGTARIEGVVRNGLEKAVEKVVVTFKLGARTVPIRIPGLMAGETRPFEIYVPEAGGLDAVSYDLEYAEGTPSGPPPGPGPVVKKLSSRPV